MLSPSALLDPLLLLRALGLLIASRLPGILPLLILILSLLLLSTLLLVVLVLPLLLLSALLWVVLILPLLLLSVLRLVIPFVPLLLLSTRLLLLSAPRVRLGLLWLALLPLGMLLLFAFLVLRESRSSDPKKQRQHGRTGDSSQVHKCYPHSLLSITALAQAAGCDRATNGLARYKKFHAAILLSPGRVTVGGHRQGIAEAS